MNMHFNLDDEIAEYEKTLEVNSMKNDLTVKIKSHNTGLYVKDANGKMTSDPDQAITLSSAVYARIFLNTHDFIPSSYVFVFGNTHDEVAKVSKPVTPTIDNINHPKHYNSYSFEVIDIIDEVVPHYPSSYAGNIQNAIKYIFRAPFKGTLRDDLKKAIWYLEHAILIIDGKE